MEANKHFLTKLIPKLLMIVVSNKFKFQDLNPIIDRDRARWMKKEPSGASTKSCNIYCISECKQKWLLNWDYFFNASIIFWNSWRPRKNFENMYDWCCLLNAYMRLIDYFGMTFASILACVLCRLLSQTWLMPKIMTSQKFRLWLLLQIVSMSGTKDRESWWLLLFVSTFWDTLKKYLNLWLKFWWRRGTFQK